jgi:hypothetical protein
MGYQKSVFHTKFENKRLTLVKNAFKKSFAPKYKFSGTFELVWFLFMTIVGSKKSTHNFFPSNKYCNELS